MYSVCKFPRKCIDSVTMQNMRGEACLVMYVIVQAQPYSKGRQRKARKPSTSTTSSNSRARVPTITPQRWTCFHPDGGRGSPPPEPPTAAEDRPQQAENGSRRPRYAARHGVEPRALRAKEQPPHPHRTRGPANAQEDQTAPDAPPRDAPEPAPQPHTRGPRRRPHPTKP